MDDSCVSYEELCADAEFVERIEAVRACLHQARAERVEEIRVCMGEPRCFFNGFGICPFCATISTTDERPLEEILRIIDAGN